jgi:hypothetical protein
MAAKEENITVNAETTAVVVKEEAVENTVAAAADSIWRLSRH